MCYLQLRKSGKGLRKLEYVAAPCNCPIDKRMSYHHCGIVKNKMERGELGPQASTPVQTNYPDSLSPNALNQTLITSKPAGAIIKADLNEQWGWGYSDTIHPNTLPTDITEEKSSGNAVR